MLPLVTSPFLLVQEQAKTGGEGQTSGRMPEERELNPAPPALEKRKGVPAWLEREEIFHPCAEEAPVGAPHHDDARVGACAGRHDRVYADGAAEDADDVVQIALERAR